MCRSIRGGCAFHKCRPPCPTCTYLSHFISSIPCYFSSNSHTSDSSSTILRSNVASWTIDSRWDGVLVRDRSQYGHKGTTLEPSLCCSWAERYYLFLLCMWQHFNGGDAIRLHLLPSLVLPAQRTFLTVFFLALGMCLSPRFRVIRCINTIAIVIRQRNNKTFCRVVDCNV